MEQLNLFSRDKPADNPPDPAATEPQAGGQKRGRKPLKPAHSVPEIFDPSGKLPAEKQYYSISEVAELFKVNASLIRFWENEFDIIQPRKNRKGDRQFRPEDILNLRLIYHLLRVRKYTIEGARQKLKEDRIRVTKNFELIQSLNRLRQFLIQLKENV